ncbi:Rop guanine nucleotide exchange factor 11 [Hibiscus syriacus]|uniref:Rop guanine nucleotide exchange factor 11 n=1 Tax=Hibiscus syriacus TaxID=106335 RepID=A0A6A3D1C2_HIBSY|nr:Rop guanine nucleotide exchange factor 11 [Hibiscus syriacus]
MLRTITRKCSIRGSSSFKGTKTSKLNHQNLIPDGGATAVTDDIGTKNAEDQPMERFAKLLLGEDMSGGGKGVSSALALSNAVTNLAASIFGEKGRLEPLAPERKARWRKEMDWILSVADHIVELVPAKQTSKDGTEMEVMVTRHRADLLANIPGLRKLDAMLIETLNNFGQEKEFWYVPKNDVEEKESGQREDKWWHPIVKVPENGLSENQLRWLHFQMESVNQVLKAAMNINAEVLSEIRIPESYIDSLPKNGRDTLGDSIYKSITMEYFDPVQFLASMDFSTEHKILDFKNRIEASVVIWRRKKVQKDARSSSWGTSVSVGKRELFEERAATVLLILKQHFPGLPQSTLDISKIQENKDVGLAILESYSRVLESLAYSVMSRIEDVLHADSLTRASSSPARSEMSNVDAFRSSAA